MEGFDLSTISDVYVGSTQYSEIYYGSNKVWPTGAPGPQGYVQDGLIFQLDGIDKGNTEGYWTDLIGNIQYSLQNVYQVNSNNVHFRATPIYSNNYINQIPLIYESNGRYYNYTIEFCIDVDQDNKTGDQIIIGWQEKTSEQYPGSLCFNFTNNTILTMAGRQGYSTTKTLQNSTAFPDTMVGSLVASPTIVGSRASNYKLILNQNELSLTTLSNTQFYVTNAPMSCIGGRSGNNWNRFFYGKIYAIRVYNRLLTNEEALHNQQLDIQRFGLNV